MERNKNDNKNQWSVLSDQYYYFQEVVADVTKTSLHYPTCKELAKPAMIKKAWSVMPFCDDHSIEDTPISNAVIVLFRKFRNIYHYAESFNSLLRYSLERKLFPPVLLSNFLSLIATNHPVFRVQI